MRQQRTTLPQPPLLRWLGESYTVVLAYLAVSAYAWYVDYRIGLALFILLPLAFVMGWGAALESVRHPRPSASPRQQRSR